MDKLKANLQTFNTLPRFLIRLVELYMRIIRQKEMSDVELSSGSYQGKRTSIAEAFYRIGVLYLFSQKEWF